MFDLSWGEIALIGVVALIVIGPKELPGLLRGMGQALAKLRRMASDFQYQFNQALQEAEVDKVKSSIDSVTSSVNSGTSFNPIDYARDQIKSAVDEVKSVTGPADPNTIGPPAPDPLAAAIPAPPTYSADPTAIQNAFAPAPIPPPAAFAGVGKAEPAVVAPPVVEEVPTKPKRTRKAEAAPEPSLSSDGDAVPEKAKRARKTEAAPEPAPSSDGEAVAEKPKRARKTKA